MYLAVVSRTTLNSCELKNWKVNNNMKLWRDMCMPLFYLIFHKSYESGRSKKKCLVAIKSQRDVAFHTSRGVIQNLESCCVRIGSTTQNNPEIIWWRNDNRRIHISAESTYRRSRRFTSIENLKITALTCGMVWKTEISEFQANIVIAWNGNVPRASDIIKNITGIGRWKEISWWIS